MIPILDIILISTTYESACFVSQCLNAALKFKRNNFPEITPFNLMTEAYPGATSVMGVWTLGLGLIGDRESSYYLLSWSKMFIFIYNFCL